MKQPAPSASASSGSGIDISQLRDEDLPASSFPGGRNQEFRVYFDPSAHDQAWSHAAEDTEIEICGVLVGKWGRDGDGPFAAVNAVIRGQAAASKNAEVTFTHETWNRINQEMDSRFADQRIVGWYHTHPDFGIFLSSRDQFIQEHFFGNPGQIAHVIDPIRKIEGVFAWKNGTPSPIDHYWVGDQIFDPAPASQPVLAAAPMDQAPLQAEPMMMFANMRPRGSFGPMATIALAVLGPLLGCMAGYWFALSLIQQVAFRGFLENYFDRVVVHQSMEQELIGVAQDLDRVRTSLQNAEAAGASEKADPEVRSKAFDEAKARINSIDNRLVGIVARYSLSEGERRIVLDRFRAMMNVVQEHEQAKANASADTQPRSKVGEPKSESANEKASGSPAPAPDSSEKTKR